MSQTTVVVSNNSNITPTRKKIVKTSFTVKFRSTQTVNLTEFLLKNGESESRATHTHFGNMKNLLYPKIFPSNQL